VEQYSLLSRNRKLETRPGAVEIRQEREVDTRRYVGTKVRGVLCTGLAHPSVVGSMDERAGKEAERKRP